jgi:flagellar assembly protein FliH
VECQRVALNWQQLAVGFELNWRELLQQTGSATESGITGRFEVFQYPAGPDAPSLPAWDGWAEPAEAAAGAPGERSHDQGKGAVEARARAEFEKRLAEETRKSFEAGRERGRQDGRQTEREAQATALAATEQRRTRQAAELIESFAQERDRYLQTVEHEVVELALAVAARILRREAQMDPLLLTGAVRVALGQLSRSTQVRLRVPPAELDLWTEAIALVPNLALKPSVVAGEGMRLGECEIETDLGSVDLGIRAQLGEIERGFFDRTGGPRAEPAVLPDRAQSAGPEIGP